MKQKKRREKNKSGQHKDCHTGFTICFCSKEKKDVYNNDLVKFIAIATNVNEMKRKQPNTTAFEKSLCISTYLLRIAGFATQQQQDLMSINDNMFSVAHIRNESRCI